MFTLLTTDGRARRGVLHTVHGDIQTPVFMNVGTCAAIKGGVSTKEYLTRYRLSRACELLRHAPLSVDEIAAEVGYPDALTFSRLFKKHIGVSPAKYRKTQINVCI